MLPTLCSGDIVIYRPIRQGISFPKKGEIVVARDPITAKQLIIKRVYEINQFGLELRGDNEKNSIDSRQFGLINIKNLCGIVEEVIP